METCFVESPSVLEPQGCIIGGTALLRLLVKTGEYIYVRPNDILMTESCDHMVKLHIAYAGKYKKALRHDTLKGFLLQLPLNQFVRVGRFCAVNTHRLTGGSYNGQYFEFDFAFVIKTEHPLAHSVFTNIGQ